MWYVGEIVGQDVDGVKACYLVLGTKNSVHLCPHSVTILVSTSHVEEWELLAYSKKNNVELQLQFMTIR